MDLQSTFDYLMQIRKKEYAIKRKQLRCEELRSCLGARAIQYDRDRVQTSPVDKVSEIICKVADLEDQIEQLQEEKALLIIEIGEVLHRPGADGPGGRDHQLQRPEDVLLPEARRPTSGGGAGRELKVGKHCKNERDIMVT